MPARPKRDAAATRARILSAAQTIFAAQGYEGATIRAVADTAGVDPALVMRYFGNKDGLFAAAARLDLQFPDLAGIAPDRVADLLVPAFMAVWRDDGPLLSLLRAAATRPTAAAALRDMFAQMVAPALKQPGVDQSAERAVLIGAHLVGIAYVRMIVRTPPLTTMSQDDLIDWLRPVIAHYLTVDRHPERTGGRLAAR